jgi:hypothetical protein
MPALGIIGPTMSYHDTLEEDLNRARAIIEEGKAEPVGLPMPEHLSFGGTIYGKDTYAAYRLLQSFVERIEMMTKALEFARSEHRYCVKSATVEGVHFAGDNRCPRCLEIDRALDRQL